MKEFNAVDLFCGAGGLSIGLENAGFNVLAGIDSNEDAINTFKKNHKNAKGLCKDMTKVTSREVKLLCKNKKIHLIAGGPPCQGFSMAGKRVPNDPRNSLFKEFLRLVKDIKPDVCVMENVRGLLSMKTFKGKKVIDVILDEYRKLNYHAEVHSINTANYGVPQKRFRIFIIARKKRIKFTFPKATHSENGFDETGNKIKQWNSIEKILTPKKDVELNYFYSPKLIKGFKRRERKNKERGMGFGWKFSDIKKPSSTISARYYKDGAESLIKYSENEIRMLTAQECASIQSFPKSFKFLGSKNSTYRQIGNAVPPLMGKQLGLSIMTGLEDKYNG